MNHDIAEGFKRAIISAVDKELHRIVEEESKIACERVKKRIAEAASGLAAHLVSNVDWQNPFEGSVDLIIRMKTK
jgi:hypothetical protein